MMKTTKNAVSKYIRSALAMLLAACMLLPATQMQVKAAALALSTSFINSMKAGTNNSIPVMQANANGPTQMELSFPMVGTDGNPLQTGIYWLRYVIGDNRYAQFKLTKTNESMLVEYTLFSDNFAGTPVVPPTPYEVHDGTVSRFVAPANHADRGLPGSAKTYYVLDDPAKQPTFTIYRETGFSFRYDGVTMHFLWDANNVFRIVTDGVVPGRLYDFDLYLTAAGASAPALPKHNAKAINGINTASIVVEPLAQGVSGELTKSDVLDWVNATSGASYNSNAWHVQPAQQNKLKLSFDLPKKLNTSTGAYTDSVAAGDLAGLNVIINFKGLRGEEHQVTLKNIFTAIQAEHNLNNVENVSKFLILGLVACLGTFYQYFFRYSRIRVFPNISKTYT